MTERRKILGTFAAGVAALPAAALAHVGLGPAGLGPAPADDSCVHPDARLAAGRHGPGYFPNAVLTTHEGRRALFYDDLLAGKTVVIHFMSTAGLSSGGAGEIGGVANLARVQEHLEKRFPERFGRNLFLYSLTVDPDVDTPRVLEDLARRHRAKPGWLFLTGEAEDLETIRSRFYVNPVAAAHTAAGHHGPVHDCSRGLLRYGNEALGLWGSCPASADPEWIAARLSWVSPPARQASARGFRRAGPGPLPERYQRAARQASQGPPAEGLRS